MAMAARKLGFGLILIPQSREKNLSSFLKIERWSQRCFAALNMTENSLWLQLCALGGETNVTIHSNSKMILPLRLPWAACVTAAFASPRG